MSVDSQGELWDSAPPPGKWPFSGSSAKGLVSARRKHSHAEGWHLGLLCSHGDSLALLREQLLATCSPAWVKPSFEEE